MRHSPPLASDLTPCRATHLLLDRDRRVVGVLVGQPQEESWAAACRGAYEALHQAASKVKPRRARAGKAKPNTADTCGERRGIPVALAHGISMGGGPKVRCRPSAAAVALIQHKGAPHAPPELAKEDPGGG